MTETDNQSEAGSVRQILELLEIERSGMTCQGERAAGGGPAEATAAKPIRARQRADRLIGRSSAGSIGWNTPNSRNLCIFNDTDGLAAGRDQPSYLIRSYARDIGGNTITMGEIDVPIRIKGKHWGGVSHPLIDFKARCWI